MRIKKFFMLISLVGITLCSCNNENIYSCNDAIDEWVRDNLSEIRVMSRAAWTTLDEEVKAPVYRAFTNQQRVDFWTKKLEKTLSLDWNEAEKEHIASVIDFIKEHPQYLDGYDYLSDNDKNTIDLFSYKWIEKAYEEFNWSKELVYGIIISGNTLLDKQGTLLTTVNQTGSRATVLSTSESNCNCNLTDDWCNTSTCEDVACTENGGGVFIYCGFLGMRTCNGRCGGI